jgi:hypothetical protein
MLSQCDDVHEIRYTGDEPLPTLTIHVPPAETAGGDELLPGRRSGATFAHAPSPGIQAAFLPDDCPQRARNSATRVG